MHKFHEQAERPLERQDARIAAFIHPTHKIVNVDCSVSETCQNPQKGRRKKPMAVVRGRNQRRFFSRILT